MLLALPTILLASVLPTVAYVLAFYWADRYEREPGWLLFIAFVWGAIPAVVISIISEFTIGAPFVATTCTLAADLVEGAVVAPVVEEIAKGLALLWLFYRRRQEFDGVLDGLMYGALVGFGFAMTENFLYFLGAYAEGGYGSLSVLIYLRAIVFGLNHALYTGLAGIGFGLARHQVSPAARTIWILAGFSAAILAHALHNLGAGLTSVTLFGFGLSLLVAGGGLGLLLVAVGLSWQHERACIQAELSDEVGDLLTAAEFERLIGPWRRPAHPGERRRNQMLVEFANRKRRLRRLGTAREPELLQEIVDLRTNLLREFGPAA